MGNGIDGLKAAFGDEFGNRVEAANKIQKIKTLTVTPEAKNDIIKFIKACWKPDTIELQYPANDTTYHLTLAMTPHDMKVVEVKYGYSLGMRWRSKWLGCYFKEAELKVVTANPDTYYFLIGWRTERKATYKMFYNMRVDGIISMEEIQAYNENKVSDKEATEKAIEQHKGPEIKTVMEGDKEE